MPDHLGIIRLIIKIMKNIIPIMRNRMGILRLTITLGKELYIRTGSLYLYMDSREVLQ